VEENLLPQTVAEVELLERKLTDAMKMLRLRKSELEAREQKDDLEPKSSKSPGYEAKDKP
jgi:hypothetical protein